MHRLAPWFLLALVACNDNKNAPDASAKSAAVAPEKTRDAACDACAPGACDGAAAQACFDLGVQYETGAGVPQDLSRAKALWDRAARAGHVGARDKVRARWGGI